jgi:predicted DNA-binding protein
MRIVEKYRGEHCLNVYVSHELKTKLVELARKYDRTTADIVRAIMKVGIPMLEGISEAEAILIREYIDLFRGMRQTRQLRD